MLAGFGRALITPDTPVMLAGFGDRHEPATEVHDELEVRALYLADSNGAAAVCLVVCDLIGMSPSFALPVRQSVGLDLGLPLSAVLTASTHTHSGPSCIAGSEAVGWPTPPGYADVLTMSYGEPFVTALLASFSSTERRSATGSAPARSICSSGSTVTAATI
jgi:hypothetical protein